MGVSFSYERGTPAREGYARPDGSQSHESTPPEGRRQLMINVSDQERFPTVSTFDSPPSRLEWYLALEKKPCGYLGPTGT